MKLFVRWGIFVLLIMLTAAIIPGIRITGFFGSMLALVIIALINTALRPLIRYVSLPPNYITTGIFALIFNTILFILAAKFAHGVHIDGFWSGFSGALVLAVFIPFIDGYVCNQNEIKDR